MRAALLTLLIGAPAGADTVTVAVASSFAPAMEALADAWEAESGHEVAVAQGATGLLHAQIARGAPFDLFLAADRERPALLEEAGLGHDRFTYARGRLAMWAGDGAVGPDALRAVDRLAIADPEVAPYGAAALEAMADIGAEPATLLEGRNAAQALLFAVTGNAEATLTAASLLVGVEGPTWPVPGDLHAPLDQDAVRLTGAAAARALHDWLGSEPARAIIRGRGFETP